MALLGEGVTFWSHLLNFLIIALALILMLVVLISAAREAGCAGAFGGAGGSSAFRLANRRRVYENHDHSRRALGLAHHGASPESLKPTPPVNGR